MATVLSGEKRNIGGEIAYAGTKASGEAISQYYSDQAIQNAVHHLGPDATPQDVLKSIVGVRGVSPEAKQMAIKNYAGVAELDLKDKALANQEKMINRQLKQLTPEQKNEAKTSLIAQGFTPDEADVLVDPAISNGIKQNIANIAKDRITRNPQESAVPQGQQPQQQQPVQEPIPQDLAAAPVQEALQEKQETPIEKLDQQAEQATAKLQEPEWPKEIVPRNTTPAEQEKWRTVNQKTNSTLLKEVKKKNDSHQNTLFHLNRMEDLNNSGKLPEGASSLMINRETGEPYPLAQLTGKVNKETQAFVKTLNDFLSEAKSFFGGRVTNFDVQVFKSRLPSLMNSTEGRRVILMQMKAMEEYQKIHDDELEKGIKHYGRNADDIFIQSVVDEKVAKQQEQKINQIREIDSAASYMNTMLKNPKTKDQVLIQDPKTRKFYSAPRDQVGTARDKEYIIWD